MSSNKALIVIPARWGSERFEGKPIHKISGKYLVEHVWDKANQVKNADKVIIATDDTRIEEKVHSFGGEVVMTSKDHKSGSDRIAEVVKNLDSDIVINVQGDEPLIEPNLIFQMIEFLKSNSTYKVITAANIIKDKDQVISPNIVKVVLDSQNDALYFSRSVIPYSFNLETEFETNKIGYFRHQGIYGYTKDFLIEFTSNKQSMLEKAEKLEQLRILESGTKIHVLLTDYTHPGVDTLDQANEIEKILSG